MLNSITGQVSAKDTLAVYVLTGGLEFEIHCSLVSLANLPSPGEAATVLVYLHHREDQLRLYGFASREERSLFLDLIKVEGIGPRQALKILSGIEVPRFIQALETEDLDTLVTLPGLGRKSAQKIILKLKGRLSAIAPPGSSLEEDLISALIGMGFERRRARQAVTSSIKELDEQALPPEELERELFRRALNRISGQDGAS
jgi:Holliday junction DNA helicase RuvA